MLRHRLWDTRNSSVLLEDLSNVDAVSSFLFRSNVLCIWNTWRTGDSTARITGVSDYDLSDCRKGSSRSATSLWKRLKIWSSLTRDGGYYRFINQNLAVIDGDRIRLFEQSIRTAVDDQLVVADQDISIAAGHKTIGLFAWTSDCFRRRDTGAVTIGDDHGVTAHCRFNTPEQQVIRPAASRARQK